MFWMLYFPIVGALFGLQIDYATSVLWLIVNLLLLFMAIFELSVHVRTIERGEKMPPDIHLFWWQSTRKSGGIETENILTYTH